MAIRFDVIALPKARDQLASLWVAAPQGIRRQISQASDFIDRYLRTDAHLKGVQVAADPDRRYLVSEPLVVEFEVSELDRRVRLRTFAEVARLP